MLAISEDMVLAKCSKCGGAAIGSTFTEASGKINHAVGLSRGIKCGDNYGKVQEIKDVTTISTSKPETISSPKPTPTPPKETITKPKESPVEQKSKPTKSKSFKE